ncbi:MAG: glycosyltransferase family 4 protein [Ktedonobacterales bacterium]
MATKRERHAPQRICMHVQSVGRTDVRVMREAQALAEVGYDVTVVDLERDSSRPAREDIRGIHFKHIVMPTRFIKTRFKPWFLVKLGVAVLRAMLVMVLTPADAYHAHEDNALPATYFAAVVRGKKLIFDAHELPLVQHTILRWRRLTALARRALRFMMPRCDGVITVSPPIIDEIQQRYGGRRAVLVRNIPPYTPPITSNMLRERLELPPQTRIALYQGGLQEDRKLDVLVRAAKYLGPDQMVILMGWGVSQQPLEALIAQEGLHDQVRIIPAVPYAELLDWTASADVGLIIYDGSYSPNVYHCLPNKLFEYLMAGLPILASQLDAVAAMLAIYDVGAITPSIAPEDVGRTLAALLEDGNALAHMRRNALAAAQHDLRWDVEKESLIALYAQVVGLPAMAAPVTAQPVSVA